MICSFLSGLHSRAFSAVVALLRISILRLFREAEEKRSRKMDHGLGTLVKNLACFSLLSCGMVYQELLGVHDTW